LRYFFIGFF